MDKQMIMLIIKNVVMNSFRYAKNKIIITFYMESDSLNIYITGDGKGEPDNLNQNGINDFYKSTDDHWGIGLYLCKMLIEKSNGSIRIKDSLHGGVVVLLEISIS